MREWPKKLRALKNYPNGGCVKKNEIGIHIKDNKYNFPSQNPYSVKYDIIGKSYEVINEEPQYEIY